jgi:hypothetical protein
MLTCSPSVVTRGQVLQVMALMSVVWVLGTGAVSAARAEKVRVRHIEPLESVIAPALLKQVNVVPFSLQHDSPILLQGKKIFGLEDEHAQELRATYQAGYTIVLLDATMAHIKALHGIIEAGVTYRSKDEEGVLAYTLRHENRIPTATLVANMQRSPLHLSGGDPDPTGLEDEKLAFNRAADFTVSELRRLPNVSVPEPRDPSQQTNTNWQNSPVQQTTFRQTSMGVYNTTVSLFALHSCDPDTRTGLTYDYYLVDTVADWTATQAKFQSAATELGPTSMGPFTCDLSPDEPVCYQVNKWRDDPTLTYCSSPAVATDNANICRYINYPLQYQVQIVPQSTATGMNGITQIEAKPPGDQGQPTSYTSGFSFNLGGTVNVSGEGLSAGISVGLTWDNETTISVPAIEFDLSQTENEGAQWNFQYCTGGDEPEPDTNCTNHVQTTDLGITACRGYFGDPPSGTAPGNNPQDGQTPQGAFSDAAQTVLWRAGPDTRVGTSTFDIEVSVIPMIGVTTANLWGAGNTGSRPYSDGSPPGCDSVNCDCVSRTTITPLTGGSYTFQIPLPSNDCKQ